MGPSETDRLALSLSPSQCWTFRGMDSELALTYP